LPRQAAIGEAENTVLVDGSVLANAPFGPAIGALKSRPARRELDRRFVYIDPTPGMEGVRLGSGAKRRVPGFVATLLGALSDIPREQPIRDNLEAIDGRSAQIRRLRHIVDAMRPEVETAIERAFGTTLLLMRPSGRRVAAWRTRAQNVAAKEAGFAFAAYGHLKLSVIVEEVAETLFRLGDHNGRPDFGMVREAVWTEVRRSGLTGDGAIRAGEATPAAIDFFRSFDQSYRVRRLRYVAGRLNELDDAPDAPREAIQAARVIVYDLIGRYRSAVEGELRIPAVSIDVRRAMQTLAARLDLKKLDEEADNRLAEALAPLPKRERRAVILTYLGFPFYDIATLPLLGGEGQDEFNPVKVDRISPDDATAIRAGGAEATLKGIQFNSFGAFFSRAYRENDYLWGRLHGADRLIDIVVSALPEGRHLPPGTVANLKREAFRAIIAEERSRLTAIARLFEELDRELA
jgi:hypothetical protein